MLTIGDYTSFGQIALSLWGKVQNVFLPKPDVLSLSYIRLFGLHGISRIWLRRQEVQGREIDTFLKSWEYAQAGVILSEPLEWLKQNSVPQILLETHPQNILSQFGPASSINWTPRHGGTFLVDSHLKLTDAHLAHLHDPDCFRSGECDCFSYCPTLHSEVMAQDGNIGALAVAIENRSKADFFKIELKYLLIDRFTPGQAQDCARIIPHLASGRSVIWPLRVYLADARGFEARILSPNVIPKSIQFESEGKENILHVRPPLREKAARVIVPGGWYHQ